jgi:adenosine deaminase
MSSIITIEQQIEELRLELAHCHLTKAERAHALTELAWLREQQRIDEEASYFATIEREAEMLPRQARFELDQLPF